MSSCLAPQTALGYGFQVMPIFQLYPKTRAEWLWACVFPFQIYVVVAFFVQRYFVSRWAWAGGGYMGLGDFRLAVHLGNGICFLVLLGIGIEQLITRQRWMGCVNLGIAALNACKFLTMNFVEA